MTIHEQYQVYAKQAVSLAGNNPHILKTDCWNEVYGDFPISTLFKDILCIEIDPDTVKRATEKGIKAIVGDIRGLPYTDESFDCILDLSTLDHIADFSLALDEYQRILRSGGICLIITWCHESHQRVYDTGNKQFYFNSDAVAEEIAKRFEVIEHDRPPQMADSHETTLGHTFLRRFLCRKK
jgi:SAM-dependent methyltransferase